MPKKTPRGQGFTVRINGRGKVYKSLLLEEQLAETTRHYEELVKQNELLRAKENMQRAWLGHYEIALHSMGTVAATTMDKGMEQNKSLLSAALLDVQALELTKELQTVQGGGSTQTGANADVIRGLQQAQSITAAGTGASCSGSGSGSGVGDNCSGSGAAPDGTASSSGGSCRTLRWSQAVTTSEVLECKKLSMHGVAGAFKAVIAHLALARMTGDNWGPSLSEALEQALAEHGKLCVMSLVADEEKHSQVIGLNLETMQPEAPPEDWWPKVLAKINLQPQQRQSICTTHQCYMQQHTAFLQQQQKAAQQLEAILGTAADPPGACQQPQRRSGPDSGTNAAAAGSSAVQQPTHTKSLPGSAAGSKPRVEAASQSGAATALHNSTAGATAAVTAGTLPVVCVAEQPVDGSRQSVAAAGGCSSSRTGLHVPDSSTLSSAGMLSLEDAERAEELLGELQYTSRALKRLARCHAVWWVNLVAAEQYADAILATYP